MSYRERGRDRERDRDRRRDRDRDRGRDDSSTSRSKTLVQTGSGSNEYIEFQRALENHRKARKQERKHIQKGSGLTVDKELVMSHLKRKKDEEEKQKILKPVFISKKKRRLMKQKEDEDERKKADVERAQQIDDRKKLERAARQATRMKRTRGRETRGERLEREEESKSRRDERLRSKEDRQKTRYLTLIKQTYLGKKKKKKSVVPPSQKFKFSFDWEATDDTSANLDPLYTSPHNTSLLFGRGFMAGVDRREQRKSNTFYDDMISDRPDPEEVRENADAEKSSQTSTTVKRDAEDSVHWSKKRSEAMRAQDWRALLQDFKISVTGPEAPNPMRNWQESGLPRSVLDVFDKAGQKEPTPIQRQGIPTGIANRDILGLVSEDSGHTAAFVVPMVVRVSELPKLDSKSASNGPYALVIAATGDQAGRIYDKAQPFCVSAGVRAVLLGSSDAHGQCAEVVIGSAAEARESLKKGLSLSQCIHIVLDVGGRSLDTKQKADIQLIMAALPSSNLRPVDIGNEDPKKKYRQTSIYAAELSLEVQLLERQYLRNPVLICTNPKAVRVPEHVTQKVFSVSSDRDKKTRLMNILLNEAPPFLVFTNSNKQCETISKYIDAQGIATTVLHGGKIPSERAINLAAFQNGEFDVLVATDIIGQGVHCSGVQQVVNFDLPNVYLKYIQRIRCAGRQGHKGVATSFFTSQDKAILPELRKGLGSGDSVPMETGGP